MDDHGRFKTGQFFPKRDIALEASQRGISSSIATKQGAHGEKHRLGGRRAMRKGEGYLLRMTEVETAVLREEANSLGS
jgi:hypothetical protein